MDKKNFIRLPTAPVVIVGYDIFDADYDLRVHTELFDQVGHHMHIHTGKQYPFKRLG